MSNVEIPWELISKIPLLPVPPGVTQNLENPESRAYWIYITVGLCLPIILFFAAIRFYVKFFIIKARTRDDYVCLLSLFSAIIYLACTVALCEGPYGKHSWNVTVGSLSVGVIRLSLATSVIYSPFIWFIKLSLFLLYLEVFSRLRWLRTLIYISVIITGLFYFSSMVALLALCAPRNGLSQMSYWTAIASPRCSQNKPLNVALGVVNIFSDFFILIVPLPAVWSLQLPTKKKVGISAIILTGLAACICSILGLHYRISVNKGNDNTWNVIPLFIVNDLEMTAGVIIPCMPSLAALIRHIRPSVSTHFGKYRTTFRDLIQSHKKTGTYDSDSTKASSIEHEYEGKYVPIVESVHSAQISQPLPDLNPPGQIRKITEFHVTHAPYKTKERGIRPPGVAM